MGKNIDFKLALAGLCLALFALPAVSLAAENSAKGKLVVDGKPVEITRAYAYEEARTAFEPKVSA